MDKESDFSQDPSAKNQNRNSSRFHWGERAFCGCLKNRFLPEAAFLLICGFASLSVTWYKGAVKYCGGARYTTCLIPCLRIHGSERQGAAEWWLCPYKRCGRYPIGKVWQTPSLLWLWNRLVLSFARVFVSIDVVLRYNPLLWEILQQGSQGTSRTWG